MQKTFCFRFITALFLLFSFPIFGQKITVLSEESKPIDAVFVFSKNGQENTFTNVHGKFDLSVFKTSDTLFLQHPAYFTQSISKNTLKIAPAILLERKIIRFDDFVISTNRSKTKVSEIANKVEILSQQDIVNANIASPADLLQNTGNVFVQKSQLGGGSPVLRGFEANRILLSLDGIRLNNAIYRGGHLQNIINIDPFLLERTEVIFGPGSASYGSDALGGVVHLYTIKPKFSEGSNLLTQNLTTRVGSANNEISAHYDFQYSTKKTAWLTSYTKSKFGNSIAGYRHFKNYPGYGTLPFYYTQINGKDTTLSNPNPYEQIGTGFEIHHLTQKIAFKINDFSSIGINAQLSHIDSIPRFDRLNDIRNGNARFATWNYEPQARSLLSLYFEDSKKRKLTDHFSIKGSYQKLKEGRITRSFGATNKRSRIESVNIYSLNTDFTKELEKINFYYGMEAIRNDIQSNAYSVNINTLDTTTASTRYPDGGSYTLTGSSYFIAKTKFNSKFNYQISGRYNYNYLNSKFISQEYYPLPFSEINLETNALTGGIAIWFQPSNSFLLNSNLSTAFRTPNVDDVGKVFDSQPGTVIVPNNNLNPERAYNYDLNITFKHKEKIQIHSSSFLTYIDGLIEDAPSQFNGIDSIFYDGELSQVRAQQNIGNGIITGTSIELKSSLSRKFAFSSSINYTKGFYLDSIQSPLPHIPPLFGKTSLRFKMKKSELEFFSIYNGWKKLKDYSNDSADRLEEATSDGTPSWFTMNLKLISNLSSKVSIITSVENILDQNYKPFSSGPFAPGRNLILTAKVSL